MKKCIKAFSIFFTFIFCFELFAISQESKCIKDTLYIIKVDYGIINKPFDLELIAINNKAFNQKGGQMFCDGLIIKVPPIDYTKYFEADECQIKYYELLDEYNKLFKKSIKLSYALKSDYKIRFTIVLAECQLWQTDEPLGSKLFMKQDKCSFNSHSNNYILKDIIDIIKISKKDKAEIKESLNIWVEKQRIIIDIAH